MRRVLATSVLLALAAVGCAREAEKAPPAEEKSVWRAKGKIVSIDAENERVRIDHQDIPGLMGTMTMDFRLADAQVGEGLAAGDAVEFLVAERTRGLTVTEMRKIREEELEKKDIGKTYSGEGRVKVVNRMAAAVILEHEGIPGEMGPAELAVPVAPASLLEGIEDGMAVEFTLTKTEQGLVITSLEKK